MKRLNVLFTLSSLNVLLVTAERFSPTTQVLLQPDNFLRLHELVQMVFLILFTVIIPCFVLYTVTSDFATLQGTRERVWLLLFIVGIYFYATGNGVHEVASFLFNNYCPQNNFTTDPCKSMFFDDYYFGNAMYFVGAFLLTIPLLVLERLNPVNTFTRRDFVVLSVNSLLYAFAIMAYAGFDRVLVGLVYSVVTMIVVDGLLLLRRTRLNTLPFTTYSALSYTIGVLLAVVFRLSR